MAEDERGALEGIGSLLETGMRLLRKVRFAEAESYLGEGLSRARGLSRQPQPIIIDCLACLANLYTETAHFDRAADLLEEALAEADRQGASQEIRALLLNNKGGILRESSRHAEALSYFSRAAELDADPMSRAQANENAGLCLSELGRFAEARDLFERSLDAKLELLPHDHPLVVRNINNLAQLHHRAGDYGAARTGFNRALSLLAPTPQNARLRAVTLNNRALLQHETGDYQAAFSDFIAATDLFRRACGEEHQSTLTSMSNLGALLLDDGRGDEAESLLKQCEEIRGRNGPESDHAISLNMLGLLYLRSDRLQEAEAVLKRAIDLNDALGDQALEPAVSAPHNNLALVAIELGNFDDARDLLTSVVRRRREALGDQHPTVEQALFNLGSVLGRLGEHREARRVLDEAAAIDEAALRQVFSTAADAERNAFLLHLRSRWNLYLSIILNDGSEEAIEAGLEFVLRRRALGLETLAAQALLGRAEHTGAELGPFGELVALLREANGRELDTGGADGRRRLSELRRRQLILEREVAAAIPAFCGILRDPPTLRAVVAELAQGRVLVEIVKLTGLLRVGDSALADARYLAFVVGGLPEVKPRLLDLGSATDIEEVIAAYLKLMDSDAEADEVFQREEVAAGGALLSALRSLVDAIKGSTQILVAPDGEFCRLPLAVLPVGSGRRLIDDSDVSFVVSGRDLLSPAGSPSPPTLGPPIVLGDPAFDAGKLRSVGSPEKTLDRQLRASLRTSRAIFEPLPGTREEAEVIGQLLRVSPRLGRDASSRVITEAKSPAMLHLATHGFFLEDPAKEPEAVGEGGSKLTILARADNPLLHSGIVLAGANPWIAGHQVEAELRPAVLTAADLATCDLRGTRLVTLSACQTGRGDIQMGEGVFGLQRALTIAGAAAVAMSMWSVPDIETKELMILFYKNFERVGVVSGLCRAQRSLKARSPDPRDWGAFVVLTAHPRAEQSESFDHSVGRIASIPDMI